LHTQFAENDPKDQELSSYLYGGDDRYRLCQETILGIGGVQLLREMGYSEAKNTQKAASKSEISTYHMNEGHAALLTLALMQAAPKSTDAKAWVKEHCIFTTHTPVPAGHDTFPQDLVVSVLGKHVWDQAMEIGACREGRLNMSYLALNLSRYTNGVAKRHMEVSQDLLGDKKIVGITNGVHASRWVAPAIGKLFDRQLPGWRKDNAYLRWAWELPSSELAAAHGEAKTDLFARIKELTGEAFDPKVFTIGFARRATPYKRMTFLFSQTERLLKMAESVGPIQLVFAGKAHPRDLGGKESPPCMPSKASLPAAKYGLFSCQITIWIWVDSLPRESIFGLITPLNPWKPLERAA
jgi:starch phosphorylase